MGSANYNGWPGFVRDRRMPDYRYMIKKGMLPALEECVGCGLKDTKAGLLGYHSEEYGPTLEEYRDSMVVLCPRCHGFLHVRHQFPRRWRLYLKSLHEGVKLSPFPHMWGLFHRAYQGAWQGCDLSYDVELHQAPLPYLNTVGEPDRRAIKPAIVDIVGDGDVYYPNSQDPLCYPDAKQLFAGLYEVRFGVRIPVGSSLDDL